MDALLTTDDESMPKNFAPTKGEMLSFVPGYCSLCREIRPQLIPWHESQLLLLDNIWDDPQSSSATLEEDGQTSGLYLHSASQPSSTLSLDAAALYLSPILEPSHTLAPLPTTRTNDYQGIDVNGGVPYNISSSDLCHWSNGFTRGYDWPSHAIPILPCSYGALSPECLYTLSDGGTTRVVPHNPLNDLDMINHADGSFLTRSALGGLGSHLDSSWSPNTVGDDTFTDFHSINPIIPNVEHVDTSTLQELQDSSLERSPPSLNASSSQPRYACHHPQCGGRTFNRRCDRDRHTRKHDGVRQHVCPRDDCARRFYRKDKLRSHLKKGH